MYAYDDLPDFSEPCVYMGPAECMREEDFLRDNKHKSNYQVPVSESEIRKMSPHYGERTVMYGDMLFVVKDGVVVRGIGGHGSRWIGSKLDDVKLKLADLRKNVMLGKRNAMTGKRNVMI